MSEEWTAEELEGIDTDSIVSMLNEYQRMLDLYKNNPPYSHRNGETEEPEVNGYYWLEYPLTYLHRDGKPYYVLDGWADGEWGNEYSQHVEGTKYYGPIPQPKGD